MKILIAVESHFKEYGGPYTAICQKIEYLNKRKIFNKLIFIGAKAFISSLQICEPKSDVNPYLCGNFGANLKKIRDTIDILI